MCLLSYCSWWVGDNPKNGSRHLHRPNCCFFTPQCYLHHICRLPIALQTNPLATFHTTHLLPWATRENMPCPCIIVPQSMFLLQNIRHFRSTQELISSPTMAPETQQHFTEIYCDKESRLSPSGDDPCIWDLCSPHRCVQQLQSSLSSPQEARTHI